MNLRSAIPILLAGAAIVAPAQVSVSIGLPGVRIGINVPVFPELVAVPDAPVYYAPDLDANYFFYDGLYWVYQDDFWYSSSWYNGPWRRVDRYVVPVPLLRVPVRFYRRPPAFFRGWHREAPPHWGEHWGRSWEDRHRGWDRDERHWAPAPIPEYQRQYSGDRYPRGREQHDLYDQHYRYRPQDPSVAERYRQEGDQGHPRGPQQEGRGKGRGKGRYPYPPPPGQ